MNQERKYTIKNIILVLLSFIPFLGLIIGIIYLIKNKDKQIGIICVLLSIFVLILGNIFIINNLSNYTSKGIGDTFTQRHLIRQYWRSLDNNDMQSMIDLFPNGTSASKIDNKLMKQHYDFDTDSVFSELADRSIDTTYFNSQYNMTFKQINVYYSYCNFSKDDKTDTRFLIITIGTYNNTYYLLSIEDMGDVNNQNTTNDLITNKERPIYTSEEEVINAYWNSLFQNDGLSIKATYPVNTDTILYNSDMITETTIDKDTLTYNISTDTISKDISYYNDMYFMTFDSLVKYNSSCKGVDIIYKKDCTCYINFIIGNVDGQYYIVDTESDFIYDDEE
ncbi:MAG: hypothetical protein VZS44_09210 [Bacilli bacterium]|nr:hypothetical protein [Bacilli bacterium]